MCFRSVAKYTIQRSSTRFLFILLLLGSGSVYAICVELQFPSTELRKGNKLKKIILDHYFLSDNKEFYLTWCFYVIMGNCLPMVNKVLLQWKGRCKLKKYKQVEDIFFKICILNFSNNIWNLLMKLSQNILDSSTGQWYKIQLSLNQVI